MQRFHVQVNDDLFVKAHSTEYTASDITRRALEEFFKNHPEIQVSPKKAETALRKLKVYLDK